MKPERIFELIVWLLIVAGGLVTAYVSFGILSSEASGQLEKYSFSGAIAGALVSWGVLTSVYLQVRGSSRELEQLRDRTVELEHKLIRGAPKPEGFTIEVDERQRIVLARPEEWQPKGGLIFDLELSEQKMKDGDTFVPTFRCFFEPIDPKSSRAAWVDRQLKDLEDAVGFVGSFTTEMVPIGAELAGVKESLKIIVRQFVRIEWKRSPVTGNVERNWSLIHKDEAAGILFGTSPESVSASMSTSVTLTGYALRKGGVCYVGTRQAQANVSQDGKTAVVTVLKEDIAYRNQVEIEWENPEVHGLRSNKLFLGVSRDDKTEEQIGIHAISKPSDELIAQEPNDAEGKTSMSPKSETEEPRLVFQQVVRMRVICYNEPLKRIYTFDFWDDAQDFNESSALFNQVLKSVRFLD
ncbi:hypothetical protein Nit79A3_1731 [Nitrosomonas sp. Is79A3]|uniref:hypothetical protein n=1 Tax=Nitrosomonas sp. (strain Is79A3) TaxID=261292 RepID=UPI000215C93A